MLETLLDYCALGARLFQAVTALLSSGFQTRSSVEPGAWVNGQL